MDKETEKELTCEHGGFEYCYGRPHMDISRSKPTKAPLPEPLDYQLGKFKENFIDLGIKVNEIIQYLKEKDKT